MKPDTEAKLIATLEQLSQRPDRSAEIITRLDGITTAHEDLAKQVIAHVTACPLKHSQIEQRFATIDLDVQSLKKRERETIDTEITQARETKKHWTRFSIEKAIGLVGVITLALSGWVYALIKLAFTSKGHPLP